MTVFTRQMTHCISFNNIWRRREFFLARWSLWPQIKRSVLIQFDDLLAFIQYNKSLQGTRYHFSLLYPPPIQSLILLEFMIYDSHRLILITTVKCIIHFKHQHRLSERFSVSFTYVYEQYFDLLDSLSRQI